MTKFLYQYLDKENLHYLAELHDEDGVMGEDFFNTTEEFLEHVKENNIEYVGAIDFNVHLSEVVNKEGGIESMNGRIYPPDFFKKLCTMKEIKDLITKI
jgi:hypothetical protein